MEHFDMEYLGSVTFVDVNGNLVRQDDYFDVYEGMPYTRTTILRHGVQRRGQPTRGRWYAEEPKETVVRRYEQRSWTGADLEITEYQDQYGKIRTEEKVIRLNTGDDDMPRDGRFSGGY